MGPDGRTRGQHTWLPPALLRQMKRCARRTIRAAAAVEYLPRPLPAKNTVGAAGNRAELPLVNTAVFREFRHPVRNAEQHFFHHLFLSLLYLPCGEFLIQFSF